MLRLEFQRNPNKGLRWNDIIIFVPVWLFIGNVTSVTSWNSVNKTLREEHFG